MNVPLTAAESRVLRWLEASDFDNTGCRHSQDTIAAGAQCTRRTVIRATRRLADLELIRVEKERRPGCKWACNVYYVRDWNPQIRRGVLSILKARRQAQCHTEGTAALSRVHTRSRAHLPSPQSYCQHAARERGKEIGVEGCPDCLQAAELNERLGHELAAQQGIARREAMRAMAAERRLSEMREDDPDSEQIRSILELWRELTGHKRAKIPASGKRWAAVKRALKDHTEGEVIEAIEGLALFPYVGAHGRKPDGVEKERYDDVEHALRDEITIQRFRSYRNRAKGASFEAVWEMWERTRATSDGYYRQVLHRLYEEEAARKRYREILEASCEPVEVAA